MTPLAAEDHRIATHLARTERALRRAPTGRLRASQRTMRARALDALHDYWAQGRFPRNPRFAKATPFFIDAGATRCAMAWVLEQFGAVELGSKAIDHRSDLWSLGVVAFEALPTVGANPLRSTASPEVIAIGRANNGLAYANV